MVGTVNSAASLYLNCSVAIKYVVCFYVWCYFSLYFINIKLHLFIAGTCALGQSHSQHVKTSCLRTVCIHPLGMHCLF